jgi:hypothetical protein
VPTSPSIELAFQNLTNVYANVKSTFSPEKQQATEQAIATLLAAIRGEPSEPTPAGPFASAPAVEVDYGAGAGGTAPPS